MKELTEQIKKQIKNCSDLLAIFQQERQLYCDKQQVGINEVMQILERKKTLVEVFDNQQAIMKKVRESENDSDSKTSEQKVLLRELGSLLEQLLVIDHENEKLLRENLSCRKVTKSPVKGNNLAREPQRVRPALQRQLPFIPGSQQRTAVLSQPVSAMAPVVQPSAKMAEFHPESDTKKTTEERHPRALHQLKKYAKTRLMKLDSKYA